MAEAERSLRMRQSTRSSTLSPVPSVFTKIINGELPGRFVWSDERCVAFLSIAPLRPGHTLVVPRKEVDHWVDADDDLVTHLMRVGRRVGAAAAQAWVAPRAGVIIAGFEVPHMHVHVFPAWGMDDFNFRNADSDPDPSELDRAAETLRIALRDAGHGQSVPES